MRVARTARDAPEIYHGTKALSKSSMDELLRCPARFKVTFDAMGSGDHDQTEAMLCGSLFHAMTLEPDTVSDRYHRRIHDGSTKAGKEEAAFARDKGLELVRAGMWDECAAMSKAARAHPLFIAASRSGTFITETSIYWHEGPVPCKARIDLITELPMFGRCVVDLKSTQDASPSAIAKSVYNYGYHRQAAWYLRALSAAGLPAQAFILLFVEKAAPYVVSAYNVSEAAQGVALNEIRYSVDLFKDCSASGVWPGYTSDIITEIDLPEWAYRRSA